MFGLDNEEKAESVTQVTEFNIKKILFFASLVLISIVFIASTVIYNYYQITLKKNQQALLDVIQSKENYINLMVDKFNDLDVPDKDIGFQKALWEKSAFYGFGDVIEVVYISERPSGLVFLFHMEDQELYPTLEIRTIDELNSFQKQVLRSPEGTINGKDYANVDVIESYTHIENLPWVIVAKIDRVKIQAPFIRHVSMILALIIFCFALGFLVLNRLNRIYLHNFKAQAERNNELINTSSNVIYTLDIDSHKTKYISDNIKYLTGHEANEILTDIDYWAKHVHPDDLIQLKLLMSVLFKKGKAIFEYRLRNKQGDYIWIQDTTRILKNKKNEAIEIIGSWVDVTHLKQAESEIKDQKDYSENLLQNLSSPTFIIDPKHKVLFWNKACEELTGLPAEKVVGTNQHWRGFYRLQRPCLADVYIDRLNADELYMSSKQSDDNQGRLHAENWCSMYSGQRLYLAIDVGPIFDNEGKLVAVVENLRDLTAHRMLETELIDARDKALSAVQTKSQFLANMSHEIRTPMNGVLGMLDLLKQTKLSDEQTELVNTAFYSAESLLDIINEILDFTKLDAGKLQVEIIKFNLHKLLKDIERLIIFKVHEKDIQFNVNLDSELPKYVFGDPTRVRQILINLLGNAVKFTEKGFISLSVKTHKKISDDISIQFDIEDTGIGIPLEKQGSLFDEFSQVDASTTRNFGGTGLGLAITKKLLDLLGGRIELQSQLDHGSCFSAFISFEIADEGKAENTISNIVPLIGRERTDLKEFSHLNILLVEDNKVNQKVALGILKNFALQADVAENGQEAVMKVKQGNYQLILMDCQMPVMSGYEATGLIRQYEKEENKKRIVIIAMTANAMQGDREKCLAAGMDDYVSKPVDKAALREKINSWLSKGEDEYNNEVYSMTIESSTNTLPLIDASAMEDLRSIMEDEFAEVLQMYLDESLTLMSDVHDGFSEESDKLIRAVHTLKSSSNNVGAKRLGEIAAKMEALVKAEDIDVAKTHLDELQEVFTETHSLIKKQAQDEVNDVAI